MRIELGGLPRTAPEPEVEIAAIERRIGWVLAHPGTSPWLQNALAAALGEDPVAIANDVEMLRHLLMPRSRAYAILAADATNRKIS